jgi:hypothetical protein
VLEIACKARGDKAVKESVVIVDNAAAVNPEVCFDVNEEKFDVLRDTPLDSSLNNSELNCELDRDCSCGAVMDATKPVVNELICALVRTAIPDVFIINKFIGCKVL